MRHYGLSKSQLYDYVGSLHWGRLGGPINTAVYSILPDGAVKVHRQVLRKGTPVFRDPAGAPVMIASCGNPITRGPGPELAYLLPKLDILPHQATAFRPIPVDTAEAVTPELYALYEPVLIGDETPPPPVVQPPPPHREPPPVKRNQPIIPTSGSALSLLAPLLGGGALIGFLPHHNGGKSFVPPPPSPEPASLLALGVGVATLGLRRRRR